MSFGHKQLRIQKIVNILSEKLEDEVGLEIYFSESSNQPANEDLEKVKLLIPKYTRFMPSFEEAYILVAIGEKRADVNKRSIKMLSSQKWGEVEGYYYRSVWIRNNWKCIMIPKDGVIYFFTDQDIM